MKAKYARLEVASQPANLAAVLLVPRAIAVNQSETMEGMTHWPPFDTTTVISAANLEALRRPADPATLSAHKTKTPTPYGSGVWEGNGGAQ